MLPRKKHTNTIFLEDTSEKFVRPLGMFNRHKQNVEVFKKIYFMVKNKPDIKTSNPLELVKWLEKIVKLYKLIK